MPILFIFFLSFLLSISTVCAEGAFHLTVDNEKGKVISYYDEYYVVQVNGTINLYNGFNSTVYNLLIPFSLDSLLIFEISDTDFISHGQLEFPVFNALETKTFKYEIRGIVARNPMKDNKSVFLSSLISEYASMHPLLITKLDKADIETQTIDTRDVVSVADRRIVTVIIENPSNIYYNVSAIHVLKTASSVMDPNNEIEKWTFPEDEPYLMLNPMERYERDIEDLNASPGEVYWLKMEMDTDFRLISNGTHSINLFDQDDLLNPENLSLERLEELGNVSDYLEHLLYVKKTASSVRVFPGDIIDVDIRVNNFAPISRNITIKDTYPLGFELVSSSDVDEVDGNDLLWRANVNPKSTKQVSYQLEYVDKDLLGIDYYEPATISYAENILYTQRTPFVRQRIPLKNAYIQKHVRPSINDEYIVELTVKNIGQSKIDRLLVKEYLGSRDVFREISMAPQEKGLWMIENLDTEEEWTVSYVTNDNPTLTALPDLIGLDSNNLLRTLVFETQIKSEWVWGKINMLDKYGFLILLVIITGFIFINRWRRTRKERDLRSMGKRIHKMRVDTSPNISDNIQYLKEESLKKSDLPDSQKLELPDSDGIKISGFADASLKEVSKDENAKEAKDNLENLKKLHEDTEKKKQDK